MAQANERSLRFDVSRRTVLGTTARAVLSWAASATRVDGRGRHGRWRQGAGARAAAWRRVVHPAVDDA